MTLFADTNWLAALYFHEADEDRTGMVERYMRRHPGPLWLSHISLLEARNVFAWQAKEPNPEPWRRLLADFGGKILVDAMNWPAQRERTEQLLARYSHKQAIGTFDATLVASALLCGANHFLSFDTRCKALAAAEGLNVFPPLDDEGKRILASLRA